MISINDAKIKLLEESNSRPKGLIRMNIDNVFGLALGEDLIAKCDSPPFHQSAMDGYAINTEAFGKLDNICLESDVEISAGSDKKIKLKPNTAVRIFTGAKVPLNCNLVIPQEHVNIDSNNKLQFNSSGYSKDDNIRHKGSQFKKGELILEKGSIMNAAKIAIAVTAGHEQLKVIKTPKVRIIVCGNELALPGSKLSAGQIYESNSVMITALLKEYNIEISGSSYSKDSLKQLQNQLKKAFQQSDIVLVSGGISVGKYDLVQLALTNLKTQTVFYKIKQKPGKPLYFGRNKNKFVFGLPGNPAATLTCLYEYVLPFIQSLSSVKPDNILPKKAKLLNDYKKKAGLTHFLKAMVDDNGITILPDQESYKLTSFAMANCLAIIPEDASEVKKGEFIEYHLI